MRFTIPLIALPIALMVAFQVGKNQTVCTLQNATLVGQVKSLTITVPQSQKTVIQTLLPFLPTPQDTPEFQNKSLLITPDQKIYTILHESAINLSVYEGQSVYLTGDVSTCYHTIHLQFPQNVTWTK